MLPVTILNSPAVAEPLPNPPFGTSRDIAGIVLWAIGWLIETIADADKVRHVHIAVSYRERLPIACSFVGNPRSQVKQNL